MARQDPNENNEFIVASGDDQVRVANLSERMGARDRQTESDAMQSELDRRSRHVSQREAGAGPEGRGDPFEPNMPVLPLSSTRVGLTELRGRTTQGSREAGTQSVDKPVLNRDDHGDRSNYRGVAGPAGTGNQAPNSGPAVAGDRDDLVGPETLSD